MTGIPSAILNKLEPLNLPSIPKVLLDFLRLVEDENVPMSTLADVVKRDPALSARILTVANSPALRQIAENKSIEQCLAVIGISLLRTIAACLAIQSVFTRTQGERHFDLRGFWRHSLLISEVAREIAITIDHDDIEEAYLSALMHDIGQPLLLRGLGEEYGAIIEKCIDEDSLLTTEKHALGTDHAAAGAWLVDRWMFSSFMADAVKFHHYPANEIAFADQLIQIIWAAHVIADSHGSIEDETVLQTPELASAMTMLDLDSEAVEAVHRHSYERVALLADELGISDSNMRTIPHYTASRSTTCSNGLNHSDTAESEIENRVRNMALMQPLLMNLLRLGNEAEILLSLREASKILFDLGEPSFLLVYPDKTVLSGANILGQPELLQRLNIQLASENSLAATSVLENKPLSTFDPGRPAQLSMTDTQLARILCCEGLLYIPMNLNNRCIGLIIYRLGHHRHAAVQDQLTWIMNFAQIAATSIETCRNMKAREQKLGDDIRSSFEQQARKVIHEAGNPLGIIKNYLGIVGHKLPDEHGVRDELGIISEEIDRVSQIVRQLNQPKPETKLTSSFDINKLIESMLTLYGESLFTNRGIFIQKNLEPSLAPIEADRNIVKQILMNIWKNGAEAMESGGCFVISTRDSVNLNGEFYTEIQMSDSGPGLPHDVINNIFEPLEPDRKPGHYGIGLSIVDSLVKQLDGLIFFHSHPGVGTSFSILLPRSNKARQ